MLLIISSQRMFRLPDEIRYYWTESFQSHWVDKDGNPRTSDHSRKIYMRTLNTAEVRERFLRALFPGFDSIIVRYPYLSEMRHYVYRGSEFLGTFTESFIR